MLEKNKRHCLDTLTHFGRNPDSPIPFDNLENVPGDPGIDGQVTISANASWVEPTTNKFTVPYNGPTQPVPKASIVSMN